MYSPFFTVIYVRLSLSPRAIVSLGSGGNHAVILSSVCFLFYYKAFACFVWGWVQVEKRICKWILVYRNHFLPQLPHNLWWKSHQHFHLEEALAVLHPLGTLSVSAKPKGDASSPSHLPRANAMFPSSAECIILYFCSEKKGKQDSNSVDGSQAEAQWLSLGPLIIYETQSPRPKLKIVRFNRRKRCHSDI